MNTRSTIRKAGLAVLGIACAVGLAVPGVSGAAGTVSSSAGLAPTPADATVLNDWNTIAQAETIALRPTAHGQARGIAMVQGAVYDAVNAIDRGHEPYLLDVEALDIEPSASYGAAIATAAHDVLVALVASSRVDALTSAYATTLDGITDGASETEGIRAGAAAAEAMLAARADDGFLGAFTFDLGSDPGEWRPVTPTALDPDPWVGNLEPFLMDSPSQFRSSGPNSLTSAEYTKEFNEVKRVGSLTSTVRTPDQTTAAIFWQAAPTALWNRMVRDLSHSHHLDAVDEARLLAMTNLAAVDGAIACWNDKYHWQFWRPMAAIREAGTDGNPDTVADPEWKPLFDPLTVTSPPLTTPPFPDHPSGHGCVTGAVVHAAQDFFGTDKVSFAIHSSRFPREPRHFDRFSDALKEVIDARIWGGIHFRTADVQGAVIGKKVAHWLDHHYFGPVGG